MDAFWSPVTGFLRSRRSLTCAGGELSASGTLRPGQVLRTLRGHTQNVMGVAFSPDGRTLASVSGSSLTVPQTASKPGELLLWTTATGELVRKLSGHTGPLTGVSYHPNGESDRNLELGPHGQALGRSHRRLRQSLAGHQDWVHHVAFSPDGATDRDRRSRWGNQDLGHRQQPGTLDPARPYQKRHLRDFQSGWTPAGVEQLGSDRQNLGLHGQPRAH